MQVPRDVYFNIQTDAALARNTTIVGETIYSANPDTIYDIRPYYKHAHCTKKYKVPHRPLMLAAPPQKSKWKWRNFRFRSDGLTLFAEKKIEN